LCCTLVAIVYALKALITNLPAAKDLSRLRTGLRAHIKGLTIIIDNLLVSPQSHLVAILFNILVLLKVLIYLHRPIIRMFVCFYLC